MSLYSGLGIKSAKGKLIYKRAVERAGRIQAERANHERGSKEYIRLTNEEQKIYREGLSKALALNPKLKKKRILTRRKR
jgi:hypothetical protein